MGLFTWTHDVRDRVWAWFSERAHGAHARAWLFAVSFSESSFFLVPPDVLLVAILLAGAERWVFYASLTTVASVLGGAFGYVLGAAFFDTVGSRIISLYDLAGAMARVSDLYHANAFWAVFTAAFTPIPYKVFVLAAGFFKIDFFAFMAASLLGRGLRFFAVAFIVRRYGEGILALVMRYFNVLTALFILGVLALVFLR